jgi:hypothetical protein
MRLGLANGDGGQQIGLAQASLGLGTGCLSMGNLDGIIVGQGLFKGRI